MPPADGNCTFSENDRLTSPTAVARLLETHDTVFRFPIKCCYRVADDVSDAGMPDARLAVVVPKRRLRRAVDRNRVKRLMREAYRVRKFRFIPPAADGRQLLMCWIYVHDGIADYKTVEKAAAAILERISRKLNAPAP